MAKRQSSSKDLREESKKNKMNNKEEIDLEGEPQKFILMFHKVFHEYHETRIKREEEEANVNSDSIDGLVGDFFSKITAKIGKTIQGKNENDNKGVKFLKMIDNFFHSIFSNSKNK